MHRVGTFGDSMAERFRLKRARACSVVRLNCGASFAVTRLTSDASLGKTLPIPTEPAFVMVLMLQPMLRHELWIDGKPQAVRPWQQGSITVVDLEQSPSAFIDCPSDVLHFYLPKTGLSALADQDGTARLAELDLLRGSADPVIHALGRLLLPALERPEQSNQLFLSGLMTALHGHLASTYGESRSSGLHVRGGLSANQLARAKEIIATNLSGDLSLVEVAAACELSPAHFARAFKRSTGFAPHRWLLMRRVEVAKRMLLADELRGAEVACLCGFADQSHLIRVFSSIVGVTPREWQRQKGRRETVVN
ncbi:AraC family transcriptional regulator [Paraburkholderia sp. BL18I3N2]|nr:AraC family transcriptional regulator [Paraburkholderia sp. BL18I3N2]